LKEVKIIKEEGALTKKTDRVFPQLGIMTHLDLDCSRVIMCLEWKTRKTSKEILPAKSSQELQIYIHTARSQQNQLHQGRV